VKKKERKKWKDKEKEKNLSFHFFLLPLSPFCIFYFEVFTLANSPSSLKEKFN